LIQHRRGRALLSHGGTKGEEGRWGPDPREENPFTGGEDAARCFNEAVCREVRSKGRERPSVRYAAYRRVGIHSRKYTRWKDGDSES